MPIYQSLNNVRGEARAVVSINNHMIKGTKKTSFAAILCLSNRWEIIIISQRLAVIALSIVTMDGFSYEGNGAVTDRHWNRSKTVLLIINEQY